MPFARFSFHRCLRLAAAAALLAAAAAQAADYGDITSLLKAGQPAQAQVLVEQRLAATPKDPQLIFLRGVAQSETKQTKAAIETFNELIRDYPELPEPYNNLAVLYAQDNQLDKARVALEMAVRSNPRYIAKDGNDLKDTFGRAGAAVKLRISSTELKLGEMRTKNPIFHSSDTRLLPETNQGWQITSTDIPSLSLQAGRFTKWTDRNARKNGASLLSNYSGINADAFAFAGGTWATPVSGLSLTGYWGRYADAWNTLYLGSFYKLALADKRSLSLSLNVYRNTDTGKALAGEVNNTTWSLMSSYAFGPHKIGMGYQKVDGDTPFDYTNRGSIWLENAMQLSDFNGPHEASWQIKYDVDLGQLVTPGLTVGIAYTRGSGIDYRNAGSVYTNYLGASSNGGKHWERDVLVRYTVQQGMAKGLALQVRWGMHRNNAAQGELNVNQVRLLAEMPVRIF